MNKKYNLQEYIDRPIDFTHMQHFLAPYFKSTKLKVITKDDFENKTVKEIFNDEYAPFVIYFIENEGSDVGHYTTLIWLDEKTIESFDPLGNTKQNIQQNHQELVDFCDKNDLEIDFNKGGIQSKLASTCSRHCVYRCMLFNIKLDDFYKFYPPRKDMTPDEFVSSLIRYPKFN
jgi:hypothetical protein